MAAVDYFLKIDGIEGESLDEKHKGEIDVLSWSWGESQGGSTAGGGSGAGRVSMQDVRFEMGVSKASPKFMLACARGEHLKKAVLTCRKAGAGQHEFLKIALSDVLISSYQTASSMQTGSPIADQVSLSFAQIMFEYIEQKADGTVGGTVRAGWDVKANKVM
ncbi:MAG: Hcp family type VI secretion system effector [Nitrospiraceae bacterium]